MKPSYQPSAAVCRHIAVYLNGLIGRDQTDVVHATLRVTFPLQLSAVGGVRACCRS